MSSFWDKHLLCRFRSRSRVLVDIVSPMSLSYFILLGRIDIGLVGSIPGRGLEASLNRFMGLRQRSMPICSV